MKPLFLMILCYFVVMEKGLLLLSGGFDSPVAGYLAKQKTDIVAVHFASRPFYGIESEKKAADLAKKLGLKKLFIINLGQAFKDIAQKCNHKYYFVLSKRLMLKVGEVLAEKQKCSYIVTGENLGQVSSQTLSNLSTISLAVKIPVLRPLLNDDKDEIIVKAKEFGFYDIAVGPETCDFFGPKHPATVSTNEQILLEEQKFDLNKIIEMSMKNLEEVNL